MRGGAGVRGGGRGSGVEGSDEVGVARGPLLTSVMLNADETGCFEHCLTRLAAGALRIRHSDK